MASPVVLVIDLPPGYVEIVERAVYVPVLAMEAELEMMEAETTVQEVEATVEQPSADKA